MFSEYNYNNFPQVLVKFNGNIKDDKDYYQFINKWLELYADKKEYNFLFDTRDISLINISYAHKVSSFIKELKKLDKQWLTFSIIIVNSKFVRGLLSLIFKISKPVAPVYIVSSNNIDNVDIYVKNMYSKIINKESLDEFEYAFISPS